MAPFELRAARDVDLDAITELLNRAEQHDGIPHALSPEELRQDLDVPYVDLAGDTRVAVCDGELAGWAWVWCPPFQQRQDRAIVHGKVGPDHRGQGVGRALLGWGVDRAAERLRGRGHDQPKYIRVTAYDSIEASGRLYSRMGFRPVRWFDELVRPLESLPQVGVPHGVVLMPWPEGRDDETLNVHNAAFADHWGSTPLDADIWQHVVRGHGARPDLSVVAVHAATDAIVGLCLNHAYPEDNVLTGRREAWVEHVATVGSQRGRGLATAMIGWSLAAFATAGFSHAMIGVDADSPTGAARLYRNIGFESDRRSTTYQIEVR